MSEALFLIVGLGNPGEKYRKTRHNVGFSVVDALCARWHVNGLQNKFKSECALLPPLAPGLPGVFLMKPQTFMNLSGEAVSEAVRFYKVPLQTHFLAITDDLDLPEGILRLRTAGGSGGHNGLKSLIECLGTEDFPRLRVGIGRSAEKDASGHVLAKMSGSEQQVMEQVVARAADGAEQCLKEGFAKAMNTVNQRSEPK